MNQPMPVPRSTSSHWQWPVDLTSYDRAAQLSSTEDAELQRLVSRYARGGYVRWFEQPGPALDRLLLPIQDALKVTGAKQEIHRRVVRLLVLEMVARHSALWAWTRDEWLEMVCPTSRQFCIHHQTPETCRQPVVAVAYLLDCFNDFFALGHCNFAALASKVFGPQPVHVALQRVQQELLRWGYGIEQTKRDVARALSVALLRNGSPYLEDLTLALLEELRQREVAEYLKSSVFRISRVLAHLGILDHPLPAVVRRAPTISGSLDASEDRPDSWSRWCQRWRATSTLAPKSRTTIYYDLLKIGRWLAQTHPAIAAPEQWTREVAVEFVGVVDRMRVGQWIQTETALPAAKRGKPLTPHSKSRLLGSARTFFQDCQEWGWIRRHFDPRRCFATPRSLRALIAPNPRVIADDIWAKLLWAGLNLTQEDLPVSPHYPGATTAKSTPWYPLEMVRAMVVVWLFAGLRSDEFRRLRVGCIRWQRQEIPGAGTDDALGKEAICWLDVPTNKTGTAFTKPVDRVVGEAIAAWEHVRPQQPSDVDPKTGEVVHYLFAYRGRSIAKSYINQHLIPLLCRKAGVPTADARGDITSHRARSTIASQLYNAREPLSLFELQEWLGHRDISSTQQCQAQSHPLGQSL